MTKGLDSAQQKAAEKTQKRMSKAGNKVLLDRLVAMPAMMALSGLDDIRDCIVFCDMSTTEDLLRVEPISIDAFFQGDAPEGLEDLSEGLDDHTRAVIERNRQPGSPLYSAVVRGAGSGPGAPFTLIWKSLPVEPYELAAVMFAAGKECVLSLDPSQQEELLQRLIHRGGEALEDIS